MTRSFWTTAAKFTIAGLATATLASGALAQKRYDPGANDKEIVIGNIMPYSGPASAYGVIDNHRNPGGDASRLAPAAL